MVLISDPISQPLPQELGEGERVPSPVFGRGTDLSEAKVRVREFWR